MPAVTDDRTPRSFLLISCLALLIAISLASATAWLATRPQEPGALYGPPPQFLPATHDHLGVNVELTHYDAVQRALVLDALQQAGVRWLRQTFPWDRIEPQKGHFDWAPWDAVVQEASARGVRLIAVLNGSPAWARGEADAENPLAPPQDPSDFGKFAATLGSRYGEKIDYYQLWDEPNIAPHWGARSADPTQYLALLREGYIAVKAADANAWVLMAGLAPNAEAGGANMSDLIYLDRLYLAGGSRWFDIAAAKAYGFQEGPEAAPDPARLNFSRIALLREVMVQHGDVAKPLWAVEYGWNALPAGWQGQPSIWGQVTAEEQATYAVGALARARREWPWLGLLAWATYQPDANLDDPHWGFALVNSDGRPRPVFSALAEAARAPAVAGPGRYAANAPAATYHGQWRVAPLAADVGATGDLVRFRFEGTRLDLIVRRMPFPGLFYVTVDGLPANRLPRDRAGRAYLILYDPNRTAEEVTVAAGLQPGLHEAEIVAEGGWGQWALEGFIVAREAPTRSLLPLAVTSALLFLIGFYAAARAGRQAWSDLVDKVDKWSLRLRLPDERWHVLLVTASALTFVLSRWLLLDLLSLALLAVLIAQRPHVGPALVMAYLPFFLHTKVLAGRSVSLVELGTLALVGLLLLRAVGGWLRGQWKTARLSALDAGVLAFLTAAALATIFATHQGVARHEFRRVLLEGVLFYFVVSRTARSPWPIVHGWVIGGVAVSLFAIYQAFISGDVIVAEGVQRVHALYGSPNNLALYLDRVLPFLIAVAAFARSRLLRLSYTLAALPVALALFLTFSKGAWLLGLPAALLFLGLARGRRSFLAMLGAIGASALALLPFLGTERFARTLDLETGTTFFRLRLWQGTLNMLKDHPWFGVGPDNFLYLYRARYALPDAWQELGLSHPHNIFLDLWTRLGILGLISGLCLLVIAFRRGWVLARRLPDADRQALALGLLAGLVATVAHGLIDNSFFLVDLMFVFMMTLGLIRAVDEEQKAELAHLPSAHP